MTKKIITILAFSLLLLTPVLAQDSTEFDPEIDLTQNEQEMLQEQDRPVEIENSNLLKANLIQNTQNPNSKEIIFEMEIESVIDTDRLRITWDISRGLIVPDESQLSQPYSGIIAGRKYRIPITVIPNGKTVSEIEGTARIIGVDSSAIATVRKNFATNTNSEILPLTGEYKQKKLIETIKTVAIYVIIATFLGVMGFFGWEKFKKWYNKD